MKNKIYPCLWFDNQSNAAAEFYCNVFPDSKIKSGNPMVVIFELYGKKFMALNGGPVYKINSAISMFVTCDSMEEIERFWNLLSEGGTVHMQLDKYPWSERYGWVKDKFGMSWQLMLGTMPEKGQKITTSFLFANKQYGKGADAMKFYTSIFPEATIDTLQQYKEGSVQPKGFLEFGQFTLNDEKFVAMDGPGDQEFSFSEGLSLVVECETQDEIDFYWSKLTEGGEENMCGWLKDKFGVSWQVVPEILGSLMNDPEQSKRVMEAFMIMKKFDIQTLLEA